MSTVFHDSSYLTLRAIRGACWRGDMDQLESLAHGLRTAAAAVGAGAFAALCRSLEAACQQNDWRSAARLVDNLAPALDQASDPAQGKPAP